MRGRIHWKYAPGLKLTDPGFDHTELGEFRSRLVGNQAERLLLDLPLERLRECGLVRQRGRQPHTATYVLAAVRSRKRLEPRGRGDDRQPKFGCPTAPILRRKRSQIHLYLDTSSAPLSGVHARAGKLRGECSSLHYRWPQELVRPGTEAVLLLLAAPAQVACREGDEHDQVFRGRSSNIGPEIGHRPSSSPDSGQGVPEHVRPHLRPAASIIIRGHDHP